MMLNACYRVLVLRDLLARLGWPQQPRILEIDAGPGYNLLEIYPPMHGSKDVESDEVLAKVAAAQSPVRVFRASVESRTGLSSTIAISCGRTQTPAFIDPDDLSFAQGRVGDSCHSISPRDSRSPQQRNSSLVSRQEIGVCSWMNVRVTTTETLHGVSQGSSDSRSRQR